MSQLPPPPEDTLVTSAGVPPLLPCLAWFWERGAEEPLKAYFQEGALLACLLGLMSISPFPDEDPNFGPELKFGVWVGVTAAHSLASKDEALLCISWSELETWQFWRSSSEIQAPRLRCWGWCPWTGSSVWGPSCSLPEYKRMCSLMRTVIRCWTRDVPVDQFRWTGLQSRLLPSSFSTLGQWNLNIDFVSAVVIFVNGSIPALCTMTAYESPYLPW